MSGRSYRLILSLLAGIGFTGLLTLALNIPSPIVLFISLLLFPGVLLSAAFFPAEGLGPPVPLLVFNACFYSLVAYFVLDLWLRIELRKARLAVLFLAVPVLLVAWFACIPSMSPLWPQGMSELADKEKKLREGLPLGSNIESARTFLRTQKIEASEQPAQNGEVIYCRERTRR